MNSHKEIGLLELSEILNKYLYFIILITVLFSVIITTNYYFNNYNLFKIKTKINFIPSLERSFVENLVVFKEKIKIKKPEEILDYIDKYTYELRGLYSAYNVINKKNSNLSFEKSFRKVNDLYNLGTLSSMDKSTFIPYFLDQLNDFDKFKYFFQKNGIKDDLIIAEIFNNLDYKFEDKTVLTSNFFLQYNFTNDLIVKIETAFNQLVESVNNEIHKIQLNILLKELKNYKIFYDDISLFNKEIINSFVNNQQARGIIKENVYKKILDYNDFFFERLLNDFIRDAERIENQIIYHTELFERVRKSNEDHISSVKKELSKNNFIFFANAKFNVFDSTEKINVIKDTAVVMSICLFFGFILSFFLALILYIKTLYIAKN